IPEYESALVCQAASPERMTTMFIRGDFARPGETVMPGVPGVLPPLCRQTPIAGDGKPKDGKPEAVRSTSLDLAEWLFSPEQPLMPRVTVNRVWQQLFGRGLVETESDFGSQGARPTHPELLDWLATEFSQQGFQSKRLIRQILKSATYRQTSIRRDDL